MPFFARAKARYTLVPRAVSLADELLADRRREAHQERA